MHYKVCLLVHIYLTVHQLSTVVASLWFLCKKSKKDILLGEERKKLWLSKMIHVSITFHIFALSPKKRMNKDSSVDVQKKHKQLCQSAPVAVNLSIMAITRREKCIITV